jgi:hypothetical protein
MPADNPDIAREEQLLQEGNVRPETSAPAVQHRPAQAALEEDDVTHERGTREAIVFVSHIASESANEHSPVTHTHRLPLLPHNIYPLTNLTPNLLACARILSGRNLLTMNDIARFARPTFDPLALLLEHVCESTQVPAVRCMACNLRTRIES